MAPALEEMLTQADGLIFDCDGTLVNSLPVYSIAWSAGFALSGVVMSIDWYKARNGLSEHVLMDHFERDHQVVLNRKEVIDTMRQHYLDHLVANLKEITAVTQIVRRFAGQLPMAVASGGSREIVSRSLDALGITTLFDAVITFDDVGVAKPEPDLFLKAAYRLGIAPACCLAFEDSPQGIEAARRAGMPVLDVAHLQ
jgi:HAD superfamily hydrolase (TIGR01509 family)